MVEGRSIGAFLPPEEATGRLLPLFVSRTPELTSTETIGTPLSPSRFTSKEGDMSIDIYTNTLCHGSGSKGRDHHCTYCFLSKKQLTDVTMMGLHSFNQILQWFTSDGIRSDDKGKPRKTVSLLGGEFALHPDAKEMIKRVHAAGLNVHIVTSGSDEFRELLKDEDIVTILNDQNRDNLVAVSMDSIDENINDKWRGPSATRKAKTTIAKLQELAIPFRINATVTTDAIDGLPDLYDFAQEVGAQKVLVHFPSPVGMGEKFDPTPDLQQSPRRTLIPVDNPKRHKGEWYDPVMESAYFYNRFERSSANFEVECQVGHDAAVNCAMLEDTSSLQFTPPISEQNPDNPVVACGINMAEAKTMCAYLFHNGDLYERAGRTEKTIAAEKRSRNSLECPFSQGTGRACIYEVDSVPKIKLGEPLRITIDRSASTVFESIMSPQTQSLLRGDLEQLTIDEDYVQKGTVYSPQSDEKPALSSFYVNQFAQDKRLGLRDMAGGYQVLYKLSPIDESHVDVALLGWDEGRLMRRPYTQEDLVKLKQLVEA